MSTRGGMGTNCLAQGWVKGKGVAVSMRVVGMVEGFGGWGDLNCLLFLQKKPTLIWAGLPRTPTAAVKIATFRSLF